jgi:hypothetical protein
MMDSQRGYYICGWTAPTIQLGYPQPTEAFANSQIDEVVSTVVYDSVSNPKTTITAQLQKFPDKFFKVVYLQLE